MIKLLMLDDEPDFVWPVADGLRGDDLDVRIICHAKDIDRFRTMLSHQDTCQKAYDEYPFDMAIVDLAFTEAERDALEEARVISDSSARHNRLAAIGGFAVSSAIHSLASSLGRHIPIIVWTKAPYPRFTTAALYCGASWFVFKYKDTEQLLRIAQLLHKPVTSLHHRDIPSSLLAEVYDEPELLWELRTLISRLAVCPSTTQASAQRDPSSTPHDS